MTNACPVIRSKVSVFQLFDFSRAPPTGFQLQTPLKTLRCGVGAFIGRITLVSLLSLISTNNTSARVITLLYFHVQFPGNRCFFCCSCCFILTRLLFLCRKSDVCITQDDYFGKRGPNFFPLSFFYVVSINFSNHKL